MSLIVPDDFEMEARLRDRVIRDAEKMLEDAVADALRKFLARCREEIVGKPLTASLVAPGTSRLIDVGTMHGWWDTLTEDAVRPVQDIYRYGRASSSDGALTQRSLDNMGVYVAQVRDRLSRTATPTIPDQAMATIRKGLADELSRGSPVDTISRRLASDLDWQGPDVGFWNERRSQLTDELEARLSEFGPPGSSQRADARLNDETVRNLQAQRSEAVRQLDADQSQWHTRAERIARTETTGAYNAGALAAFEDERAGVKMWLSTADERTRESHLDAGGLCIPVDQPFNVGGAQLMMPGDPSGPPEETINCRCTMVAARSCEELSDLARPATDELDKQREDRGLPPGPQEPEGDPMSPMSDAAMDEIVSRDAQVDPNDPDGLTTRERAVVRDLENMDLGHSNIEGELALLPEDRLFTMQKATSHGHEIGPCTAIKKDGRLLVVEDRVTRFRITDGGAREFLDAVGDEVKRAHPGGVDSPLKSIMYAAEGNVASERHFGFQIGGLASRDGITMYYTGKNEFGISRAISKGVLRHEIGHSLAHAASQKVARVAQGMPAKRRAAQEKIDAARPEWMRRQVEEFPYLAPEYDDPRTTANMILERLPWQQQAQEKPAITSFVRARNKALRDADAGFDDLVRHTGDSRATWDDRITFGLIDQRPGAVREYSSATPGTAFQTAARKDADRLQNMRSQDRLQYSGATWDERRVSIDGYESFDGRAARPGVTNYAASVGEGVEDWAETWRLYTSDRIDGRIGAHADGRPIRFAELFPERAAAIEDWARVMEYDLSTIAP